MKLTNVKDVEKFIQVIKECEHDVYLKSQEGDVFNLKSSLSQYIAIGRLVDENGDSLELFASSTSFVSWTKRPRPWRKPPPHLYMIWAALPTGRAALIFTKNCLYNRPRGPIIEITRRKGGIVHAH